MLRAWLGLVLILGVSGEDMVVGQAGKCPFCAPYQGCNPVAGGYACVQCSVGYYALGTANGGGPCTQCNNNPPNSYFTGAGTDDNCGRAAAWACNAGLYSSGGSCISCPPGTYSAAGAAACSICPQGTYSAGGSKSCTPCLAGTCSGSQAGGCSACLAGSYSGVTKEKVSLHRL